MPEKEVDRREEILDKFPQMYPDGSELSWVSVDSAKYAMDEHFTERAYELLEYMAKRNIECRLNKYGDYLFWDGDAALTKEQLFENFL